MAKKTAKTRHAEKPSAKSKAEKPEKSKAKPKAEKPAPKADHKSSHKADPKAKGAKPKAPAKAPVSDNGKEVKGKSKPTEAAPAKVEPAAIDPKKPIRKGITIVSPKPARRPKPGASTVTSMPAGLGRLLDPKGPARKPLIPSGPKASSQRPLGQHGGAAPDQPKHTAKSPFGKKELEHFRTMLVRKRAELVGDVSTMETQALRSQSGSLSNMPSHLAEQGSEAYDQSLSLDLAAADRKLIREIDDALKRIAAGTYGICELTGKPIKLERLEELPWARYSIEAARELERQSMRA